MQRSAEGTAAAAQSKPQVQEMSNDALIISLLQTLNHLSRWLTPIHDRTLLEYSPRRSEPSVKDVLLRMRDVEARMFAYMHAIATEVNPDLDRVPMPAASPLQAECDREADPLVVMSELRRVRESTTSLLRALPDTAWQRDGYSRLTRNWTIREIAEYLADQDRRSLAEIDRILDRSAARHGIASASRVPLARIDQPFRSGASRDGV
jgi:hypothetical protein